MAETSAQASQTPPPVSSLLESRPQEMQLRDGAFDPPVVPGTLGKVDRFDILRLLGQGGMGQVYLAREPLTDRRVALKVMRPELAGRKRLVDRFLSEARHMHRLSHPNILRVQDVSAPGESPHYTMPYIEGGNLQDHCAPDRLLPPRRVLHIARQIAGALAYAHKHGIIHRDLKPANVLLDKKGDAYLTDFGLFLSLFNDSAVEGAAEQTEGPGPYLSPAVARGEAEDTRHDIYAFGALLYELLVGRPPYTGSTAQAVVDQIKASPPPPIRSVNPKADPGLTIVAEGCMARELRDRYAAMNDVLADLTRIAEGGSPHSPHGREPGSVFRWAVIGSLVVLALFGVATRLLPNAHRVHGSSSVDAGYPVPPEASVIPSPNPFVYETGQDGVTITRYAGEHEHVQIPPTLDGMPVTAIGSRAFQQNDALVSVALPACVTRIAEHPFYGCANLETINVDTGNVRYCSEDGVLFDKTRATLIVYPEGKRGHYAIPPGVTRIEKWAFRACSHLPGVFIPASVKEVVMPLFSTCVTLGEIQVERNNPFLKTADGVLFDKSMRLLIAYPGGRTGDYVIPDGVTTIRKSAFEGCIHLANVTLPASVSYIADRSFWECRNLRGLYFKGDPPYFDSSGFLGIPSRPLGEPFKGCENATVYHLADKAGWKTRTAGLPTTTWTLDRSLDR